jgi:23S rRNA (guanine745-N1)-methyltransferase
MVKMLCTVRNCQAALQRIDKALVCDHGHRFDVARSGYFNLLQPQDKRSKNPGDAKTAALARRRFIEAGQGYALKPQLLKIIDALQLPPRPAILDVGCGEGYYLAAIAEARDIDGYGVDISAPAIELAARRYPKIAWIVANADRSLPFMAGGFDLIMSITARKNPAEFNRALAPQGRLLIALPAEDDLIELRAAILGQPILRSRIDDAKKVFAAEFELESHSVARVKVNLSVALIQDLLTATYRGARNSQQNKLAQISSMDVTISQDILVFRPRVLDR